MWKNFKKEQPHAQDYRMHETDRICPDIDILGKCPKMSVLPDEYKVPHQLLPQKQFNKATILLVVTLIPLDVNTEFEYYFWYQITSAFTSLLVFCQSLLLDYVVPIMGRME